jgi:integrase
MASIHRDPRSPRGVWYCSLRLADGSRAMRSTATKGRSRAKTICEGWQAAEDAARDGTLSAARATEILNETLIRCGQQPIERLRTAEWFESWLESRTSISAHVRQRYASILEKFLLFLGPESGRRFLDLISTAEVRAFLEHLQKEGRTASTINRIRRNLSVPFARAVKLGKLRHNPVSALEAHQDEQLPAHRTFAPQEVTRLVKTAGTSDWAGAILLGYTTGLRLGDIANLDWSAIDLQNGIITLTQRKTKRQVWIALHSDFSDWLLGRSSSVSDEPDGFVFPTLAGQASGGKRGLSNAFGQIVERAGIDAGSIRHRRGRAGKHRRALSFHSLRHGALSAAYNNTIAREAARRLSGHAEHGALDRYLHVDLEAVRATGALIPRLPPCQE